jgi:ADP-ribosyl-[dinitrogen reductase] hydrolase
MLVAAFNGADKASMKTLADALVERHKAYRFDRRRMENPSGWIVETLQAVFQAFFEHDDPKSILVDVVNRGGDADTTGAIAGMLVGACYGLGGIPVSWLKTLDRDIRNACLDQADRLIELGRQVNA